MYNLSQRSKRNLEGVNPILVDIVCKAIKITHQDFTVTEGLRTLQRQKELVAQGASKTMNSYHLKGLAVDLYPYYDGKVQVNAPRDNFNAIATAMFEAANEVSYPITWGGNWKTFIDMPHYQLEL